MINNKCPICGKNGLAATSEIVHLDMDGNKIAYISEFCLCQMCGADVVTPEQSKKNKRSAIAAKSDYFGVPAPEAIRMWREKWALTQQAAGKMLGVGPVAFSKYENAAQLPSEPTTRLLQIMVQNDEAVVMLAAKHGVTVRQSGPHSASAARTLAAVSVAEIAIAAQSAINNGTLHRHLLPNTYSASASRATATVAYPSQQVGRRKTERYSFSYI